MQLVNTYTHYIFNHFDSSKWVRCNIYVDTPSFKATGVIETNTPEVTGAGNDWSVPFPNIELSKTFVNNVVKLGKYLYKKHKVYGMWGVDSIWYENDFRINEINCRLQGTTEVSSLNQLIRLEMPFYIAHLASFLNVPVTWMDNEAEINAGTIKKWWKEINSHLFT